LPLSDKCAFTSIFLELFLEVTLRARRSRTLNSDEKFG